VLGRNGWVPDEKGCVLEENGWVLGE